MGENKLHVVGTDFNDELYNGQIVNIRRINFGFLGAIGLRYRQFATEVRYENIRMGTTNKSTLLNLSVLNFILSYSIGK
jgi:hypothetical protein